MSIISELKRNVSAADKTQKSSSLDQWIFIGAFCVAVILYLVLICTTAVEKMDLSNGNTDSEPIDPKMQVYTNVKAKVALHSLASSGEQETCNALFRLFDKTFVKVRPPFLVNPETGRRLEIDCFNQELMLGVEYNGIQHYVYPNPFHRSLAEFEAQQRRDRYKIGQCKAIGVRLIAVPFTVKRVDIEAYLRRELATIGFDFAFDQDLKKVT